MQYAGMMELADVLDSKSSGSDTVRVRPPLPAPRRSKRHIVCSDFFKSQSALILLLLLSKSQPLALGCDLVSGVTLKLAGSILLRCSTSERVALVPIFSTKNPSPAARFLLFRKKSRCAHTSHSQARSRRFGLLPTFCG